MWRVYSLVILTMTLVACQSTAQAPAISAVDIKQLFDGNLNIAASRSHILDDYSLQKRITRLWPERAPAIITALQSAKILRKTADTYELMADYNNKSSELQDHYTLIWHSKINQMAIAYVHGDHNETRVEMVADAKGKNARPIWPEQLFTIMEREKRLDALLKEMANSIVDPESGVLISPMPKDQLY